MSAKLTVYYKPPEDPDKFETRYLEGHMPLVQKLANIQHTSFHKATRTIMGEFPYAYVFTGTWADGDSMKAALNSEEMRVAAEDAQTFAPPFDAVLWEQLA